MRKMPLKIIRQDITKIACDAIVNPTNRHLIPGGGADLAVHAAAGPELDEYCKKLGGCKVGSAVITPAFRLPCKYIIHTAGPNWYSIRNSKEMLISCYKECLKLAAEYNCESVAMPLISSGSYGYPKDKVIRIATAVITDFLLNHEMTVYLLVYDKRAYEISRKLFSDITAYVDDNYIRAHNEDVLERYYNNSDLQESFSLESIPYNYSEPKETTCADRMIPDCQAAMSIEAKPDFDEIFRSMDKGFAETLFYYIDQKGITDVECYKKSNVDKKTFSKIKCNRNYKPSKVTAVSFAIGLRLNLSEANHLLSTVGMCLSHAYKFDVIIEYFIKTGNYKDIFEVNEVLYQFDQQLLGV